MYKRIVFIVCLLFVNACSQPGTDEKPQGPPMSNASIDGNAIKAHIEKLASDEMEGRAPGSKGEELATAYIADFYKSIGLKTSFQPVPLVGITSTVTPMRLMGKMARTLKFGDEFVAWSGRQQDSIQTNADLVFAGYGVVAPEYQWDDFKEDVKGKIIVVLINDPQLEDQSKFGGRAMTYYGRWTYKFEEAARQGAAGALIVHETDYAGYGWEVVRGSWTGEQFDMVRPDKGASTVPLRGWITRDVAAALFKAAGHEFDELKKKALQPDFKPIALNTQASVGIRNKMRTVDSKNVVGVLEGSQTPDEYVIFTSHWDHLGMDETLKDDKIYNGAEDNASGVAMIMEIASAFTKHPEKPKRSIVFLAVAAEEQGLLGSLYYSENPLFPLNKTLANINIDGINLYGRDDNTIEVVGFGYNTLEDILREVAQQQGRNMVRESEPEKGYYFRSDQFSFAKKGVPALYADSTTTLDDREYTENRYHKPSDEYNPNWDMKIAVNDAKAFFEVALRVANGDKWPDWKPGAEFKAAREESLKK